MHKLYFKLVYRGRYIRKMKWMVHILAAGIANFVSNKGKHDYSNSWIIGAGDDRYENNVRTFYEYMQKKHPEIKIYWIADKLERIPISPSMLVKRGSVKNYLIALNASVGLSSHSDADIAPGLYRLIKNRKTKIVHLDHGQAGLKSMDTGFWDGLVFDAMCCFSAYERSVKMECGIPEEKLFSTGYAHSDDYDVVSNDASIRTILVMPTWRDFYINGDKVFENTMLYRVYKDFFSDKSFKTLCEKKGISVTFILHPTFDNYYHCEPDVLRHEYGDWVEVITGAQGDMHKKIADSDMLITDYSSLLWDFIYMNKPVLMYSFDWDEFKEKRGIRLPREKTGKCLCMNQEELLIRVNEILCGNRNLGQKDMIKNFFTYIDKKNCDRIYNLIMKITGQPSEIDFPSKPSCAHKRPRHHE